MIRYIALTRKRTLKAFAFLAMAMMILGNVAFVSAAPLTGASLELGDSRPGETSTYTVDASGFTTGTTIRCVEVVLNDSADGSGLIPNNITTTTSTLDSSSLGLGSWTVQNGANGTLSASDATGTTPAASGDIVWGGVTNGDTDQTYYALLTTYTDQSCTGGNEVDTVTMAFAYKDGTLVSLTIEPTLTFVCAAVAASQTVNSATTSILSSATDIDFGTNVTTSANGISAHDLQVTTNATGGYNVYLRHTGALSNGTDTITNHTGTNGTPTAFPAAGNEAWGYTTEDADLAQFAGNLWAGFNTVNEQVMTNSAATAGTDTVRVGHQVGIATDTPAGTYTTTMIYTLVATY